MKWSHATRSATRHVNARAGGQQRRQHRQVAARRRHMRRRGAAAVDAVGVGARREQHLQGVNKGAVRRETGHTHKTHDKKNTTQYTTRTPQTTTRRTTSLHLTGIEGGAATGCE